MGLLTFKGGLHPYDGKDLSKDKPITGVPAAGRDGLSCEPAYRRPCCYLVWRRATGCWSARESRKPAGFVSANIHSSVSGTVKAVEPRDDCFRGEGELHRIVENDGEYEQVPSSRLIGGPDAGSGDCRRSERLVSWAWAARASRRM